ncbi:MAG: phage holin family protein [Anaerolineaceae bacterium]
MGRFIMRVLINAAGLWLAVTLLTPHIHMQNNAWYAFVILGLIFGLVNALIRPVLMAVSCPVLILTLGLGTLIINTLMFLLTGWIGEQFSYGFTIPQQPFLYAFLGALIVSVVSIILSRFLVHKS